MKTKNPAAVAMGKLSAASLTPEQRSERARKAANARALKLTPEQRSAIARQGGKARRKALI